MSSTRRFLAPCGVRRPPLTDRPDYSRRSGQFRLPPQTGHAAPGNPPCRAAPRAPPRPATTASSWWPAGCRWNRGPPGPDGGDGVGGPARAAWSRPWSRSSGKAEGCPGSAGRADAGDPPEPFDSVGMHLVGVGLSATEVRDLLRGLLQTPRCGRSTTTSSPPPEFRRPWWEAYVTVNRKVRAGRAVAQAAAGATVWVARLPAPEPGPPA